MNKLFLIKKLKFLQKIILSLNIILLAFNISFIKTIKIKNLRIDLFKSSDDFIMNLNIKAFKDISKYLTDKFFINCKTLKRPSFKKEIKIKSIGLFDKSNHAKWLKSKLDDEFILVFEEDNPDYLIYNVFTDEDIQNKYNNSIKIAIYTENIMPDLNLADYIIGHYHIIYLDRYFKYSIVFWSNFKDIDKKRSEILKNPIRKKFCAAVISNCGLKFNKFRLNFIDKLSEYKIVDMGGKCHNNIKRDVKNKIEFLSSYKFSIAMENSNGDGYISEKIIDSFLAGTIPIYYGDYLIDEFINPKSFILIKGENDIEKKIEYIKKIDIDNNLYRAIIREKPIIDDNFMNIIDEKEIKSFLKHIFRQNKNISYRRDDDYYDYETNFMYLYYNLKFLFLLLFF